MTAMRVGTHKHKDTNNITDNVIFQDFTAMGGLQHPKRSAAMPQTKSSWTMMGPYTMTLCVRWVTKKRSQDGDGCR